MGTDVQAEMGLPGFCTIKDLNYISGNGSWILHDESMALKNGWNCELFPAVPAISGYGGLAKAQLRQTILNHESIFRHQVHELHRLYKRQRELMNNLKMEGLHNQVKPVGTSESGLFLSRFASGIDSKMGNTSNLPLECRSAKTEARLNGLDHLGSTSKKPGRRLFGLELPADAEEKGTFGVSEAEKQYPERTDETYHRYLRTTAEFIDLNEPVEEKYDLDSVENLGNSGHCKDGLKKQYISETSYSSPQSLPRESFRIPRDTQDEGLGSSLVDDEITKKVWLSYAGKDSGLGSSCRSKLSEDFRFCGKSSEVDQRNESREFKRLHHSDTDEPRHSGIRKIFGVEISQRSKDAFCATFDTRDPQSPAVLQSDAAASTLTSVLSWRGPPNNLSQNSVSDTGTPCFCSSDRLVNGSIKPMQNHEVTRNGYGVSNNSRNVPWLAAEVSCQNEAGLGSQSDSNEIQPCPNPIGLVISNGNSEFSSAVGHCAQNTHQRYPKDSGQMTGAKHGKGTNLDASPSVKYQFEGFNQRKYVSFNGMKNLENPPEGMSKLISPPPADGKSLDQRKPSYQMSFDSLQSHTQVSDMTEIRRESSQEDKHKKSVAIDNSQSGMILGFPIVDKANESKVMPSPDLPLKPGNHASVLDNGDSGNVELVKTGLSNYHYTGKYLEDLDTGKQLVSCSTELRFSIDLNSCVNEENMTQSTPASTVVRMSNEIDLEAPVVEESLETKISEASGLKDQSRKELDEGIVKVAVQALVDLSSLDEHGLQDSLHFLAEVVSSFKAYSDNECLDIPMHEDVACNGGSITNDVDYFEFMTLNLTAANIDEHSCRTQIVEIPKDESPLPKRRGRGPARRGRQQKVFQRDVLPSIASLSRKEVTEDLQTIEALIGADGGTWQSGLRQKSSQRNTRGRRKRSVDADLSPNASETCQNQTQHSKNNDLTLEETNITGWGKRTARPPRQRYAVANPPSK